MAVEWDKKVLAPLMAVFGEDNPCLYTPVGGSVFSINGIFDAAYLRVEMGDSGLASTTENPILGVRTAQFPIGKSPRKGDLVLVKSVNTVFMVKDVHFDGHGHAKLMLAEKYAGS